MPEKVRWKLELVDSETGEVKQVLKEGEAKISREGHQWTFNLTKEQMKEQSKGLKYWPDIRDLQCGVCGKFFVEGDHEFTVSCFMCGILMAGTCSSEIWKDDGEVTRGICPSCAKWWEA